MKRLNLAEIKQAANQEQSLREKRHTMAFLLESRHRHLD